MIVAGPIQIDIGTREAWVHGAKLLLSDGEFDLLAAIATEPGRLWRESALIVTVPHAQARGARWLEHRAVNLAAKLSRSGVHGVDLVNHVHDRLPRHERGYRLFEHAPVGA